MTTRFHSSTFFLFRLKSALICSCERGSVKYLSLMRRCSSLVCDSARTCHHKPLGGTNSYKLYQHAICGEGDLAEILSGITAWNSDPNICLSGKQSSQTIRLAAGQPRIKADISKVNTSLHLLTYSAGIICFQLDQKSCNDRILKD